MIATESPELVYRGQLCNSVNCSTNGVQRTRLNIIARVQYPQTGFLNPLWFPRSSACPSSAGWHDRLEHDNKMYAHVTFARKLHLLHLLFLPNGIWELRVARMSQAKRVGPLLARHLRAQSCEDVSGETGRTTSRTATQSAESGG